MSFFSTDAYNGELRTRGAAWLAVMAAALAVGGCSLSPGFGLSKKNYAARARTIPVATTPVELGTQAPQSSLAVLALPSSAGAIKRVKEKHYVNGTRQEIELVTPAGTPGQNVIDVSVQTNGSGGRGVNYLSIGKPSERGIRSEILGRFPDVRMNIVTQPMSNRFGVFGLAIGRHRNGARCVFAWQWVDDLRDGTPGISNLTKFGALVGSRQLATSIRIRLCQKGATVDQLAGQIQGLNVMGRAPVNRLTKMDRRNLARHETTSISQGGINRSPLLSPVSGTLESTLSGRSSGKITKPVSRPRRAHKPRRVKHSGNYNRIRHYSDRGRPVAARTESSAPPIVAPGSRYLAPVQNGPPPAPSPGASAGSTYRPAGSVALPPEAYRGPAN